MSTEHFLKGVDEARTAVQPITKPAVKANPVPRKVKRQLKPDEFLGAKVKPGRGMNNDDDLYNAERKWRSLGVTPGVTEGGIANKELSLPEARVVADRIINHPALDKIPGIDGVRLGFDQKQISFHKQLAKYGLHHGITTKGTHFQIHSIYEDPLNQLQFSTGYKPRHPLGRIKLGILTHEVAHYILNNSEADGPSEHHWPMARLHLHIIKNVLKDKKAHDALKSMYDFYGVNYGNKQTTKASMDFSWKQVMEMGP